MSKRECCRLQVSSPILLLLLLIPGKSFASRTQSGPPIQSAVIRKQERISRHHAAPIHVQTSLVVTPVTVMDRSGRFVEDLRRADFRVLDNGVPQRIAQFGLALEPVTAVIVIQTNGAVAPLLREVRPLGSVFWGLLLGDYGGAAVISYADHVRVLQDFASGPKTLETTLRRLVAHGRKARLNDAIERAIEMLEEEPATERRAVILFCDGFDRGSKTSEAEVLRTATSANVAIYGLRFAPAHESWRRSREAWNSGSGAPSVDFMPLVALGLGVSRAVLSRDLLPQYASFTGGAAYAHWKKQSLQDQLQEIALEINSQYVLAYVPSNLKERGFHRIQVELARRNLRVRTRAGYFYGGKR